MRLFCGIGLPSLPASLLGLTPIGLDRRGRAALDALMRTLILLRHAKSGWDGPELSDHERPLAKRGTKDAPAIGAWMSKHGLVPDVVLCSGAVRTRATLALVLSAMDGTSPQITFEEGLYLADPQDIVELVRKVPASASVVLVVGHNPGLHMLALSLAGGGSRKALSALAEKMPTCGVAVLEHEGVDWAALAYGSCRLSSFVTPKQLDC